MSWQNSPMMNVPVTGERYRVSSKDGEVSNYGVVRGDYLVISSYSKGYVKVRTTEGKKISMPQYLLDRKPTQFLCHLCSSNKAKFLYEKEYQHHLIHSHFPKMSSQFPNNYNYKCPFPDYMCAQSFGDKHHLILHYAFEHGILYRLAMQQSEEIFEKLISEKKKNERAIEDLQLKLMACDSGNDTVVLEKVSKLEKDINEVMEENENLQQNNKKLQQQFENIYQKKKELEDELMEHRKRGTNTKVFRDDENLFGELGGKSKQCYELEAEKDLLCSKLNNLENDNFRLNQEKDELIIDNDNLTAEKDLISSRINDLENENTKLTLEKNELIIGNEKLVIHEAKGKVETSKLVSENSRLRKDRNDLGNKWVQTDALYKEIVEKHKRIEVDNKNLVDANKLLEENLTIKAEKQKRMEVDYKKLVDTNKCLLEENKEVVEKQNKVEVFNESLIDTKKCLEDENKNLGIKFEASIDEGKKIVTELKELLENTQQKNRDLEEDTKIMSQLKELGENTQRKNKDLEEDIKRMSEESCINKDEKTMFELKELLENTQQKNKDLEEDIKVMSEERCINKDEIEKLLEERFTEKEELQHLKIQNEKLESDLESSRNCPKQDYVGGVGNRKLREEIMSLKKDLAGQKWKSEFDKKIEQEVREKLQEDCMKKAGDIDALKEKLRQAGVVIGDVCSKRLSRSEYCETCWVNPPIHPVVIKEEDDCHVNQTDPENNAFSQSETPPKRARLV